MAVKVVEQVQRRGRENKRKNRLPQQRPGNANCFVLEVATEGLQRVDDKIQSASGEYQSDAQEAEQEKFHEERTD